MCSVVHSPRLRTAYSQAYSQMLAAIGETFDPSPSLTDGSGSASLITGVIVSTRPQFYRLSIWTRLAPKRGGRCRSARAHRRSREALQDERAGIPRERAACSASVDGGRVPVAQRLGEKGQGCQEDRRLGCVLSGVCDCCTYDVVSICYIRVAP